LASSTPLQAFLERLFTDEGGTIPFERFMAETLYHPEFGYYTAHIRTVGGSRGDFATSATLSSLLGIAIARWIHSEVAALALEPPIHVVEIGGGEGSLMRDVLAALGVRAPVWWRRPSSAWRFHLVEISPRLRERQRETLGAHSRAIAWHDTVGSALAAAGGTALVFSNELVDAFPVIALRRNEPGSGGDPWSEISLAFEPHSGLREVLLPLGESRPSLDRGAFAILSEPDDWPPGQRVELHAAYRSWWENWSPFLKKGALLTIDYGGAAADLYRRRSEGTLRAFFRHQRLTGPGVYRLFGRQDLTADVCFDDLRAWGESFGFSTVTHQSQADFLRQFAPDAVATQAQTDRAAAFLLKPGGAGEAFRVLGQRQGV
jgi:SAM-dependent MidA family methyltransferase